MKKAYGTHRERLPSLGTSRQKGKKRGNSDPPHASGERAVTRILHPDQVKHLIKMAPEGRIRRIVRFFLLTGMHPDVLSKPKPHNVHISRGDLVWNRAKTGNLCSLQITPDIEELITTVLQSDMGKSVRTYRHYVRLAAEKAGLEDVSPLTLRHTAVQYLFEMGKTPQEVRAVLRCSHQVLWGTYAVVRGKHEEEE